MLGNIEFGAEKGVDVINAMHKDIFTILEVDGRKSYEYVEDFLNAVSNAIDQFGDIFPHHVIWEYISERLPIDSPAEESASIRDVTGVDYRSKVDRKNFFSQGLEVFFKLPLSREEFFGTISANCKKEQLGPIFKLPAKEGYSYFNLPVFPWGTDCKEPFSPNWVVTFVYKKDYEDTIYAKETYKIMRFFAQQISLAWNNFQESVANKIHREVEFQINEFQKQGSPTAEQELAIVTRVISDEFRAGWCGFFLENKQSEILGLEFSTTNELLHKSQYDLNKDGNAIITSFKKNKVIRITGNDRLISNGNMEPLLSSMETSKPFEHCLCVPLVFGKTTVGVIVLLRTHPPFSAFVTHLLTKLQRQIFEIFLSYSNIRNRLQDLRNVINQFTRPVKATIGQTEELIKGTFRRDKLLNKYKYIAKLSRTALRYAKNFEKMMEFDSQRITLNKEKLVDLRLYLIDLSIDYSPLIKDKGIHINITKQTAGDIDLFVDKDLFYLALANIVDNAIKYSFSREEREELGFPAEPIDRDAEENVLISATQMNDKIILEISSLGLEIAEEEREKIFYKEFRGALAKRRYREGTGIGLFIAKRIIEKHGGTLELKSHPLKYKATFKITLPCAGETP